MKKSKASVTLKAFALVCAIFFLIFLSVESPFAQTTAKRQKVKRVKAGRPIYPPSPKPEEKLVKDLYIKKGDTIFYEYYKR